jgi:hypothetical protein
MDITLQTEAKDWILIVSNEKGKKLLNNMPTVYVRSFAHKKRYECNVNGKAFVVDTDWYLHNPPTTHPTPENAPSCVVEHSDAFSVDVATALAAVGIKAKTDPPAVFIPRRWEGYAVYRWSIGIEADGYPTGDIYLDTEDGGYEVQLHPNGVHVTHESEHWVQYRLFTQQGILEKASDKGKVLQYRFKAPRNLVIFTVVSGGFVCNNRGVNQTNLENLEVQNECLHSHRQ